MARSPLSLQIRSLVVATIVGPLAGCHDDGRIATFPASGVVKFSDGQPLAGGTIVCESPHGLAARGNIDSSGHFVLGTYDQEDGAVAGKHKVAVWPEYNPLERKGAATGKAALPVVADRYQNFATSEVEIEVKPGANEEFEIVLERSGG
jgi:hypothetical protein